MQYTANGIPFGIPAGDAWSDGNVTIDDMTRFVDWWGNSAWDPRTDLNADGVLDIDDYYLYASAWMGRGVLSQAGNRIGYAGYQHAPELAGAKYHVRNRVIDSVMAIVLSRNVSAVSVNAHVSEAVWLPLSGVSPAATTAFANSDCRAPLRVQGVCVPKLVNPPIPQSIVHTYQERVSVTGPLGHTATLNGMATGTADDASLSIFHDANLKVQYRGMSTINNIARASADQSWEIVCFATGQIFANPRRSGTEHSSFDSPLTVTLRWQVAGEGSTMLRITVWYEAKSAAQKLTTPFGAQIGPISINRDFSVTALEAVETGERTLYHFYWKCLCD